MSVLLRGETPASIGDAVGFIAVPAETVLSTALAWRAALGRSCDVRRLASLDEVVNALTPRRLPWHKEAFVDCGSWTAYLNEGSDPWPATSYISRLLNTEAVVSICSVEPPHASTQFQLLGPTGDPPLLYVRTLAAHCEDGRWQWEAEGDVQPFEHPERYSERRVRDRLDRPLLMEYLRALGIDADDPGFFREAVLLSPA